MDTVRVELVIANNPDLDSRLGYLLRVKLGDGLVLRTSGTWPRQKALYCHPEPYSRRGRHTPRGAARP
jgi:hypothetical protein